MTISPSQSDILQNCPHGFCGRQGGYSQGIYDSLNVSLHKNDNPEDVQKNHGVIADYFGIPPTDIAFLSQVHGADVHVISKAPTALQPLRGDALITTQRRLLLAIQTADCVPILLWNEQAEICAAIHGGWKGLLAGIIDSTLQKMNELGVDHHTTKACIGPSIFQESYEVGLDVFHPFLEHAPSNAHYFRQTTTTDKYLLDLRSFAHDRLLSGGLVQGRIDTIPHDTYTEDHLFFSCRRATHKGDTSFGNQASCIMLP